jgi:hypothetical protein
VRRVFPNPDDADEITGIAQIHDWRSFEASVRDMPSWWRACWDLDGMKLEEVPELDAKLVRERQV